MTKTTHLIKTSTLLIMVASVSMGNQKCQEPPVEQRLLKMDVEVGAVAARPVHLPNGENVDFPYVANALFYRQVMNSNHFVITNIVPSPQTIATTAALKSGMVFKSKEEESLQRQAISEVSQTDVRILEKFGFLDKLAPQANEVLYQMATGEMQKSASKVEDTLPACLYDMPQTKLAGEVISFEATWGVGAQAGVGYGPGGIEIGTPLNGNVEFNRAKLELGLRTDDPLTQDTVAIADGIAYQNSTKFGIGFNSSIPLGVNFFFNTPLADVIRKAMDKGLDEVVAKYKKLSDKGTWEDAWESRVIYDKTIANNDTHIGIRGGSRAGIKVGDTFSVTNLHYAWEGKECYTRLKYKIPLTATPIAEAVVTTVGDNVSVAQITKYMIEQQIKPGAMVKFLKYVEPPKPAAKK